MDSDMLWSTNVSFEKLAENDILRQWKTKRNPNSLGHAAGA